MAIKVGINGFGRIGRNIMRAALSRGDVDFVAVNEALGRLRRRRPFEDLSVLDTVPTAQGANVISFPTPPGN